MRTGKNESTSTFGSLKRFLNVGQNEVLPYATSPAPAPSKEVDPATGKWSLWPGSMAATNPPPFYENFGLGMMQRWAAFALCVGAATLMFMLVRSHSLSVSPYPSHCHRHSSTCPCSSCVPASLFFPIYSAPYCYSSAWASFKASTPT